MRAEQGSDEEAENKMELYITTRHRNNHTSTTNILHYDDCRPSETVGEVKARIEAEYGIAIGRQVLWLGDKLMMNNHTTLESYGIKPAVPALAHLEIVGGGAATATMITITLHSDRFPTHSKVKTVACKETDTVGELKKRILARFSGHSRNGIELYFRGTMLGVDDEPLWHYLVFNGAVIDLYYSNGPRVYSSPCYATESRLLYCSLQSSS